MADQICSTSRGSVRALAPAESSLTAYDRMQMLTYARLLDAERDGYDWTAAASEILLLDADRDRVTAELCWRSHLDRAHWIVGEGLVIAAAGGSADRS